MQVTGKYSDFRAGFEVYRQRPRPMLQDAISPWSNRMRIGVPKEIKTLEFRVSATPGVVRRLVQDGHEVFVETTAGAGVGIEDSAYAKAGAIVLPTADAV